MKTVRLTSVLVLVLALLAPRALVAQIGAGSREDAPGPWAPPSLGIRGGYDNKQQSWMLGAQLRLPILPGGQVELMPNADVTFLTGLKEYQYNLEAVYVLDGRAGGLYLGGGVGLRSTIFETGSGRETKPGFTVVGGFRIVGLGLIVPQLEYRFVSINAAPINYQQVTLGVNLSLWQPVAPRR